MNVNPIDFYTIKQDKSPRRPIPVSFCAKDAFEKSQRSPLTLNGKSDPMLDKWVSAYLELPNATIGQIELLKNLFKAISGDEQYFAKTIIEYYDNSSPQDIVKELNNLGLDLLSLDKKELEIYGKNIENFSKISLPNNVDLDYYPLIPLLDEEQIKKVAPYCDDYTLSESFFDMVNGDEEYFRKLEYLRSFSSNLESCFNEKLSGPVIKDLLHADVDFETVKARMEELLGYYKALEEKTFLSFYDASNSIKNIALATDEKWEKAKYFMSIQDYHSNVVAIELNKLDELSDLDEQQMQRAKLYIDSRMQNGEYISAYDILALAKLDESKFERAINYIDKGAQRVPSIVGYSSPLFVDDVVKLVNMDDKTADKLFENTKFLDWDERRAYIDIYSISNTFDLPLVKRIEMASKFKGVRDKFEILNIKDPYFEKAALSLEASLMGSDVAIDVPKVNVVKLFQKFLSNVPVAESAKEGYDLSLTNFENVLIENDRLIRSFGKSGIPLSYSREEYIDDLNELTKTLDKQKKEEIYSKLGIIPVIKNEEITGYNGLLRLNKLDLNSPQEKAVYDITYNFLHSNRVQTGSSELDDCLNTIISAFPEFINSIGKLQNPTHIYSNDIHTLVVLNSCISNPMYKELNPTSRTSLKLMALFHDLGKADGVVDKGHQNTSAYYVKSILDKLNIGSEISDRVFELIKNHHWFEDYNTGCCEADTPAFMFRRPQDFKVAQIFARADLLGVGSSLFSQYCDDLNPYRMQPIQDKIDKINQSGNAVYSTGAVVPAKIPVEKSSDGREYKVVNFTKINNDEDLYQYGFSKGIKKDDIRLLVHMVGEESDLNKLKYLADINNAGVLSESLISLDNKRTYCNRRYGVVLSNMPYNVVQMSGSNIGSGTKKDFKYAISACQSDSERNNFRDAFLEELNILGKVSEDEYSEFYLRDLIYRNKLTQFGINRKYKIGQYEFDSEEIKKALLNVMDDFINTGKQEDSHCEFVAYYPKIEAVVAKEDKLDDTPQYLRDYANENNLPIFLIGKD